MKKATRVRPRNCSGSIRTFPANKMFPPEVFTFYVNVLDGEPYLFGAGGGRSFLKKWHNRKSRRFMNNEKNF